MAATDGPVHELARRLLRLRKATWPALTITQKQLAEALGVSSPLISSWENVSNPVTPPLHRLDDYARIFATPRSVQGGHLRLVPDDELTDAERTRRDELYAELASLHGARPAHPGRGQTDASLVNRPVGQGFWRFADGAAVLMVCAPLPSEMRRKMPYTDPGDPDYVELYTYADPDALVELHGHIRAANPNSLVTYRTAASLTTDDYTGHLVILGGVDWNQLTRDVLRVSAVPLSQMASDNPEGAGFVVVEGGETKVFRPQLRQEGSRTVLIEDVAHFFRGPNPFNKKRTVTVCNGMYGRGTYGAVRALTDIRFRDRNTEYVESRFGNDTFSILTRVRIVRGVTLTPDWTEPETRLHEWPEAT